MEAALVPLHVSAAARRQRATMALEAVGLGDRLRHMPGELSGGQQQRVAIARALVKEPKVLLGDEPTGNLDEDTRDDIIALLETMWRERGLTMVLVTHDSSVARRAQRIGVMKNGRLSFRQPRPGRAAQAAPGRSAAAAAQAAPGRSAAAAAQADPDPAPGLVPPDVPVAAPRAAGRTDLKPADLHDGQFEDLEDGHLEDVEDDQFEDLEDSGSQPADTVTFD